VGKRERERVREKRRDGETMMVTTATTATTTMRCVRVVMRV
jgi:hypothetical protein